MIKLVDILTEGVYDPGIFKAIFTAGGPGSGKSYAASTLFGMPEKMPYVSAQGLKGVNSDQAFEAYMKKAKMPLDLQKLTKSQHSDAMDLRGKAKKVTAKRMRGYINSKLGMLIDGTGKNYDKIANMMKLLKAEGYDCYMIFVNTDLNVALQRNKERERTLPEDLVKKSWSEVNNNLGRFQGLFGSSNILVVDNSEYKEFGNIVKAKAREFVKRPVQNYIAKKWIKKELEMRKS
jgi:predicted kinase